MREIRVHLENELGAVAERVAEAFEVCRAQPELAGTLDQVDARIARRPRAHHAGGAVGRVVVHHQHVQPVRQRQQLPDHGVDVLALVVGGNDDELLHQAALGAGAGAPGPRLRR